ESGESTGDISFEQIIAQEATAALGGGPTVEDYAQLISRGGWPELVTNPAVEASEYLEGYLSDVTRVDLPATDLRVEPARMNALIRAVARNTSSEVSVTKLAAEADLAHGGAGPQDYRTV